MQEFHRKPSHQGNGFLEEWGLYFLISGLTFWTPVSINLGICVCLNIATTWKKNTFGYTLSLFNLVLELYVMIRRKKECLKDYAKRMQLGRVRRHMMDGPSSRYLQMKTRLFLKCCILDKIEEPDAEISVWDSMRMLFYENVTGHGTKNTVSPHICIISEASRNTEAFFFFFYYCYYDFRSMLCLCSVLSCWVGFIPVVIGLEIYWLVCLSYMMVF